jgi:DNA-binding transcriptional regulator YiaG
MDLAELLTLLGVIAAVIFGVPAWLTYMQGRTRRDLRHRLGRFHSALAAELRKRRQQDGLPVERFAQAVSHHVSSEDIVEWEKTGSIPHQHLGRVLDILQISDWDYRALALDHLTNEEFMSHVEPGGQSIGFSTENMVFGE